MDDWQLIGSFAAIAVTLNGCILWAVKWLLDRTKEALDTRIIAGQLATDQRITKLEHLIDKITELERELLRIRAEMSEKFVRMEDWIRFINVQDSKLESLRSTVERIREDIARLVGRGHGHG